jgi:hypothetical protein
VAGTPFVEVWDDLPELAGVVDPFSFRERLALYRLLIDSCNPAQIFGLDNEANVLWGYVFQCHWQWASGRYAPERGQPWESDRIDPESVWCHGNHLLSVVPFIAAAREGLVPELDVARPPDGTTLPYVHGGGGRDLSVPPGVEAAIGSWQEFFAKLRRLRPGSELEVIRFALWESHKASLIAAERTTPSGHASFSELERTFLSGWVQMVEFFAAAAWRTDLEFMLENGLDTLPHRPLRDDDVPGSIPDMNPTVNSNLVSIFSLTTHSRHRRALTLWLWRRAMRTPKARSEVMGMLAAQFHPTSENAPLRRKLLRYMLAFGSFRPA